MNDYAKQFVGVWNCTRWDVTNLSTQEVQPVFGGRAAGHIIYTSDGWVSASLMEAGLPQIIDDRAIRLGLRAKLLDAGPNDLDAEERELLGAIALSALSYVGYCGPFDADDRDVHHHVKSAGRPNHVGITLTRSYEFDGDELKLWGDSFGFRDTVWWRRIAAAPQEAR